jgi:hypothetical protein
MLFHELASMNVSKVDFLKKILPTLIEYLKNIL